MFPGSGKYREKKDMVNELRKQLETLEERMQNLRGRL
jgi:hypothetical protein